MLPSTVDSIIKTLVYADIFDYPLTADEINSWLIGQKYSAEKFHYQLNKATEKSNLIQKWQGFYFLPGRKSTVFARKLKQKHNRNKKKIAEHICRIIRLIPWVKLVGITGTLAMENADDDDDIDLMVITASKRLWLTRFFVVVTVELLGLRRRPNEKYIRNKICFNLFLDEQHLLLPMKERDLYSAHEILQVVPLYAKDNSYYHFLDENQWAEKHLPNAFFDRYRLAKNRNNDLSFGKSAPERHTIFFDRLFDCCEAILKKLQLLYMKKRRTTEIISDGFLRFHPQDARGWIMKKYQQQVEKYS